MKKKKEMVWCNLMNYPASAWLLRAIIRARLHLQVITVVCFVDLLRDAWS